MKFHPNYDPDFSPMILFLREYECRLKNAERTDSFTLSVCRGRKIVHSAELTLLPPHPENDVLTHVYVERMIKSHLWMIGGDRILLHSDRADLTERIRALYTPAGERAFDAAFFSRIFDRNFEIEGKPSLRCRVPDADAAISSPHCPVLANSAAKRGVDAAAECTPNSGVNGKCVSPSGTKIRQNKAHRTFRRRIGLDLGGSTLKITAILDGEIVHQSQTLWNPREQTDTGYHVECIVAAIREAEECMGGTDFIGISCAGIALDNKVVSEALFRSVPEDRRHEILSVFERVSAALGGVPYRVVNDGEISSLCALGSSRRHSILGLTLGTSLGCGYVDAGGRLTEQINELAFVPHDLSANACMDEWSGDRGVGVGYLSQDAAIKLAERAQIPMNPSCTPSEKFRRITSLLREGDPRAQRIFEDMGIYLGYSIPFYATCYAVRHILLLGGVSSGEHGNVIIETAKRVLAEEFPEIESRLAFVPVKGATHLQDEAAARLEPFEEVAATRLEPLHDETVSSR